MRKPVAVFLAVTAALVTVYFAVTALVLGQKDSATAAELALVKGVWVLFGASAIVSLCLIFEALSDRAPAVGDD